MKWPAVMASLSILAIASLRTASVAAIKQQKPPAPSIAQIHPFIAKYCSPCHTGSDAPAGLDFSKLKDISANPDEWQKVLARLSAGEMPPANALQPSPEEKKPVVNFIQTELNAACKVTTPGHITLRRLNKAEYNNTIRDLIGLDLHPADDFPSDDVGYGFDNIGDVLSMSPLLMEKYMQAAEKIAEAAIVTPGIHTSEFGPTDFKDTEGTNPVQEDSRLFYSNGTMSRPIDIYVGGTYNLVIVAAGDLAGPDLPEMRVAIDGNQIRVFDVGTKHPLYSTYQVSTPLSTGRHTLSISFTNDYYQPTNKPGDIDRNLYVRSVEMKGPQEAHPALTPSHLQIIPRHPVKSQVQAEAKKDISNFATRAFRRPITPDELDRLDTVFERAYGVTQNFEESMQVAVEATLVSPQFLYRLELDPVAQTGTRNLDDYELASRLSYFLWSSMPDETLFNLAAEKQLHKPEILEAQIQRMIQDPKADALANDFAGQWLELQKLAIVFPNPKQFPGVDDSMKRDMATETKMFFSDVLRNDLPITDFIDADFSYVNEKLAKLYGIPGVYGSTFQRVYVEEPRGGVITQASVLTVTSNPTRTSPTKRGKWVLEQILGTPPPPPPPGVGVIADEQHRISATTLRALMEEHRKNPTCAVCHAKMDPIGFGLDNFDAVGRLRTMDGAFPLDTQGTLPDGRTFSGPQELKKILLADKDKFARSLAEKLMIYGLGRGLTPTDDCALDAIVKRTKASGYRFDALITAVVESDPFLKTSAVSALN